MKWVYLLFATVFTAGAVLIFSLWIWPAVEDKNIAANGTETTATVQDVATNVTINGQPYYYIQLSFTNEAGQIVDTLTNSSYTWNDLKNLGIATGNIVNYGAEVQIKYECKKAVLTGIEPKDTGILWLALIPFGAAGLGMSAAFIVTLFKEKTERRIRAEGRDAAGTYVKNSFSLSFNRARLYKIRFTFTNDTGETVNAKTRSIYSWHEMEKLAQMGTFPVKHEGDKAVIALDKNQLKY